MRFDEVAFDLAFSEQFEPRFSDRVESRFLLLLKNTTIERGVSIDLEPDLQGTPDYLGPYGIQTLRIRALDELEETGIATFENPGSDVLNSVKQLDNSRPNPALEIVLHRRRPF